MSYDLIFQLFEFALLKVRMFLGDGLGGTGHCNVIQPSLELKSPKGSRDG